jgi:hypothetical protein
MSVHRLDVMTHRRDDLFQRTPYAGEKITLCAARATASVGRRAHQIAKSPEQAYPRRCEAIAFAILQSLMGRSHWRRRRRRRAARRTIATPRTQLPCRARRTGLPG